MPDAILADATVVYVPAADFSDYRVGNDGSVWSCKSGRLKQLRPQRLKKCGHLTVFLRRDGLTHQRLVHRLVLEAFVGPCPPGMECRHLNGVAGDNWLENLCWGTPDENQKDKIRHGTTNRGHKAASVKLSGERVIEIKRLLASGVKQAELAESSGVCKQTISDIATKRTWGWLQ